MPRSFWPQFAIIALISAILGAGAAHGATPSSRAAARSSLTMLSRLACLQIFEPNVAPSVVGVETIHRSGPTGIITVFLPMPGPGQRIVDMNAIDFRDSLPTKFIVSDGTLSMPFIRVDQSAGSRLDVVVMELAERARKRAASPEAKIKLMRTFISEFLAEAPVGWAPGITEVPRRASSGLPAEFSQAGGMQPGHYPLATSLRQPSVPLERFLAEKKGACLPKALLTSLILKKLGIPNRVRAGGTEFSGHTWIELADGRHLDPTWQELGPITTEGAFPGWFHFSRSFLFPNQIFPIVAE